MQPQCSYERTFEQVHPPAATAAGEQFSVQIRVPASSAIASDIAAAMDSAMNSAAVHSQGIPAPGYVVETLVARTSQSWREGLPVKLARWQALLLHRVAGTLTGGCVMAHLKHT
jgi:hypothetical protein